MRRLWRKHEGSFKMHSNSVYGEQHEQSQKANRSKFEKDHKKGEIGFRKDASGVWGVYSDWVYDTYQKDWSKAYQLTFCGFFSCVDYLSYNGNDIFYSHTRIDPLFRFAEPGGAISMPWLSANVAACQFGEVIMRDAENLKRSGRLGGVDKLPSHDKAVLCNILGGALHRGRYPGEVIYGLGHGGDFWPPTEPVFLCRLASEAFAHMAAAAIVNPKAYDAVKEYLPNVQSMFMEMLKILILGLETHETSSPSPSGDGSSTWGIAPQLTETSRITGKRIMKQKFEKFPDDVSQTIENKIRNDADVDRLASQYSSIRLVIIDMIQHHLHIATTSTGTLKSPYERYELTYISKRIVIDTANKKTVHQGFYDTNRPYPSHTMGEDFASILKEELPKLVMHLHPIREEYRGSPSLAMFSLSDEAHIAPGYGTNYKPLWIGIEPFLGNNGYYADIYIAKNWGEKITIVGEDELRMPSKHIERIGTGLTPKEFNYNKYNVIRMS
ncbi:MAG: hypothetical protein LBH25_05670 [Fibromonadaceae bacterium]|nr:hypothetical protein [Fibromonadaceae bacterium]